MNIEKQINNDKNVDTALSIVNKRTNDYNTVNGCYSLLLNSRVKIYKNSEMQNNK